MSGSVTSPNISEIDGWVVGDVLGAGKSATVYRATKGGNAAAIKVFNPSLVQEFGKDPQLKRIHRELDLVGKEHPHLVEIYGGGECPKTGHLYVAMELIDAPNLASVLDKVPRDKIRLIISQVASAAKFLLDDFGHVHRDIKTDNIVVNSLFDHATLLDMGVMRPVDVGALAASSDGERQNFVGTLRYSPPEYLFRTEEKTPEGFLAITFYQLGGVLYDLIMRERLFSGFDKPWPKLVKAVEGETPVIHQADVPQDLVWLAKNCLLKKPQLRLEYVHWEHFSSVPPNKDYIQSARDRVRGRFAASVDQPKSESELPSWEIHRRLAEFQRRLNALIKDICVDQSVLPRFKSYEMSAISDTKTFVLLRFEANSNLQLAGQISILFALEIVEPVSGVVAILAHCIYGTKFSGEDDLQNAPPNEVFGGVFDEAVLAEKLEGTIYRIIDVCQSSDKLDVSIMLPSKEDQQ
jgi:eukaryotic-like serine/threonine-protein kinase